MKIAYVVSDIGLVSETFIRDLVVGLSNAGREVTVICNQAAVSTIKNVRIEKVNFIGLSFVFDRIGLRLDRLQGPAGQYRTYQRSLGHAHHQLLPALKQANPDVVYIDYATVAALSLSAIKHLRLPFVVHCHGADVTSALNDAAYRQTLQGVFEAADALVVASDHVRRLLILEGAAPEKIQVIRLGVDLEGLSPLSWCDRRKLSPTISFLGRLTPKKHPIALLEAFSLVKKAVPDARLTMIGDGPEMPRVKQRIEDLGLVDSVSLLGALQRAEALSLVNQSWVFAQHSVTASNGDQEGFGISLAEAAALNLPVVSTYHNGIPEQVIHGETGFLVREFDYETMADYLIKLLNNPMLTEQMGQRGYCRVESLCQSNQRLQQIDELIASAMLG